MFIQSIKSDIPNVCNPFTANSANNAPNILMYFHHWLVKEGIHQEALKIIDAYLWIKANFTLIGQYYNNYRQQPGNFSNLVSVGEGDGVLLCLEKHTSADQYVAALKRLIIDIEASIAWGYENSGLGESRLTGLMNTLTTGYCIESHGRAMTAYVVFQKNGLHVREIHRLFTKAFKAIAEVEQKATSFTEKLLRSLLKYAGSLVVDASCEFIPSEIIPNFDNLSALGMNHNAAYVRAKESLYYVNKTDKVCKIINCQPNQLAMIDAMLTYKKKLSADDLSQIRNIIPDLSQSRSYPFSLKILCQYIEDNCQTLALDDEEVDDLKISLSEFFRGSGGIEEKKTDDDHGKMEISARPKIQKLVSEFKACYGFRAKFLSAAHPSLSVSSIEQAFIMLNSDLESIKKLVPYLIDNEKELAGLAFARMLKWDYVHLFLTNLPHSYHFTLIDPVSGETIIHKAIKSFASRDNFSKLEKQTAMRYLRDCLHAMVQRERSPCKIKNKEGISAYVALIESGYSVGIEAWEDRVDLVRFAKEIYGLSWARLWQDSDIKAISSIKKLLNLHADKYPLQYLSAEECGQLLLFYQARDFSLMYGLLRSAKVDIPFKYLDEFIAGIDSDNFGYLFDLDQLMVPGRAMIGPLIFRSYICRRFDICEAMLEGILPVNILFSPMWCSGLVSAMMDIPVDSDQLLATIRIYNQLVKLMLDANRYGSFLYGLLFTNIGGKSPFIKALLGSASPLLDEMIIDNIATGYQCNTIRKLKNRPEVLERLRSATEDLAKEIFIDALCELQPNSAGKDENTSDLYWLSATKEGRAALDSLIMPYPELVQHIAVKAICALRTSAAGADKNASILYWLSIDCYCPEFLRKFLAAIPELENYITADVVCALRPVMVGSKYGNTSVLYGWSQYAKIALNHLLTVNSKLAKDITAEALCALLPSETGSLENTSALYWLSYNENGIAILEQLIMDNPELAKRITVKAICALRPSAAGEDENTSVLYLLSNSEQGMKFLEKLCAANPELIKDITVEAMFAVPPGRNDENEDEHYNVNVSAFDNFSRSERGLNFLNQWLKYHPELASRLPNSPLVVEKESKTDAEEGGSSPVTSMQKKSKCEKNNPRFFQTTESSCSSSSNLSMAAVDQDSHDPISIEEKKNSQSTLARTLTMMQAQSAQLEASEIEKNQNKRQRIGGSLSLSTTAVTNVTNVTNDTDDNMSIEKQNYDVVPRLAP